MPTVHVYQYATVTINDSTVRMGSLSEARSITLGDGELIDRSFKVAAETAVKLFDAAEDEALGDFDFLWLESDLDVLIQFTADPGDDDKYFVVELKGSGTAGQMGPAIVLGSDVAHESDGTIDAFTGTAATVGEIWAYNEDTTDTARIRLVAGT